MTKDEFKVLWENLPTETDNFLLIIDTFREDEGVPTSQEVIAKACTRLGGTFTEFKIFGLYKEAALKLVEGALIKPLLRYNFMVKSLDLRNYSHYVFNKYAIHKYVEFLRQEKTDDHGNNYREEGYYANIGRKLKALIGKYSEEGEGK